MESTTETHQNDSVKYDKYPVVAVPNSDGTCQKGWDSITDTLSQSISRVNRSVKILCVECYPGVDSASVLRHLAQRLTPVAAIRAEECFLPPDQIEAMEAPFLRNGDPVFGRITNLRLDRWFDPDRVAAARASIEAIDQGLVLVVGCGASLIHPWDLLVYADLARWEAQQRFRKNIRPNLGLSNEKELPSLQYKRAFFIDWKVGDQRKQELYAHWDFVLDTHQEASPKLLPSEVLRRGLDQAVRGPFRVVPFFDPAPWGGQWMKDVCGLDSHRPNFGWCFDCVPEENSLLLGIGDQFIEIPSIDLVFFRSNALLGEKIVERFGREFPIRFDLLDTMGGGNLSLQVHPLTRYIQSEFGMRYTQDESYYILDAHEDACVYLGLREHVDKHRMISELTESQTTPQSRFDASQYINRFPAKKHDHFLIPAGTCHCSGQNTIVLEISATPFIFTFKLWDWGRLGLDGRPRPIHLRDGFQNIQWDRTTSWVERNLVHQVTTVQYGDTWVEERTGLHEFEFIETRRHWFTGTVPHDTHGTLCVMNLVEGDEILVESPSEKFAPFVVHYAETFIVPASVGAYTIRPHGKSVGQRCGTIKAYVRDTELDPHL